MQQRREYASEEMAATKELTSLKTDQWAQPKQSLPQVV